MRTRFPLSAPVSLALVACFFSDGAAWPPPATPPAQLTAKPATIWIDLRFEPWDAVLERLSEATGLPVITTSKPHGTFTYVESKKGRTIPEIIEILNHALLKAEADPA